MSQRFLVIFLTGLLILSSFGLGFLSGRLTSTPAPITVTTPATIPAASSSEPQLNETVQRLEQVTSQLAQLPLQWQQQHASTSDSTQATEPVLALHSSTAAATTENSAASNNDTWQKFLVSLGLVNYQALETTAETLFLGEQYDRSKAISALALVGSPEVKAEIQRLIFDTNENAAIRSTAIEAFEWHGEAQRLTQLLQNHEPSSVQVSAIYAARTAEFNTAERQQIDQQLFQQFKQTQNNTVKEAIIDYFVLEPRKLEQLLQQQDAQGIKYTVRHHYEAEEI